MRLTSAILLALSATAVAESDVVLDTTFDDSRVGAVPKGWRFHSPGGTSLHAVQAEPLGGKGLCIEVADRSDTNTASAHCSIPRVWVGEAAFRIKAAQTDQYFTVGTSGAYTWFYRGGHFRYNAGKGDTAYPNPVPYTANEWMTVSLRWNAFEKTIGLSVNGKALGDRIAYPRVGPADSIHFTSDGNRGASQPTFWVDRVTVRRLDHALPGGILALQDDVPVREIRTQIWPHDTGEAAVEIVAFADLPNLKLTFAPQGEALDFTTSIRRADSNPSTAATALSLSLPKWESERIALSWRSGENPNPSPKMVLASTSRGRLTDHLTVHGQVTELRPIRVRTPVVVEGEPKALIVSPATSELRKLALLVQGEIRDASGAVLPLLSDDKLLADPASLPHCIAIGNLECNPLLARLYELGRVRCDRGYPGRGGHVVRTVYDPWGSGKNVIALAGSDGDGIRAAVAAFHDRIGNSSTTDKAGRLDPTLGHGEAVPGRLAAQPAVGSRRPNQSAASTLVLGRLMDIKLAPSVDKAISRPNNSSMGHAGWQYYLTGRDEFARKFRDKYVRQVCGRDGVFDDEETSGIVTVQPHLFIYNAYHIWPMIEDSPVFSTSDRAKITRYFLNMVRSKEGLRERGYQHDLRRPKPRQNHQTHTAMGVYYMADYMSKHYGLPKTEEWLKKSKTFFAAHDLNSKPACDSNGHQWGASWADVLKYALLSQRHDVFLTGTARDAADRSLVNTNPLGCYVFTGDMGALGGPAGNVHMPTAYFYGEGKYAWRVSRFGSNGIRRGYLTDLQPHGPLDHVGIHRAKLAPLYYRTALRGPQSGVALHSAFDKVSLRSGLGRDAHYLLLDGIAGGSHSYDDVNTILELWHQGRALLVTGESLYGHSMKHHNGLVVVKDGEGGRLPMVAELRGAWDLDSVGFVSSRVSAYCGMDWTRHLLWRKDEYVLVLDELIAREPGDYSLQWYWRTLGEPELLGRTFRARQRSRTGYRLPKGVHAIRASGMASPVASSGKSFRHMDELDAFLYRATEPGDYFEVQTNIDRDGTYGITAGYLRYNDRGSVQLSIDGKPLGAPTDLFATAANSSQHALGSIRLTRGAHRFRFTMTAKRDANKTAFIAVQYLVLANADSAEQNRAITLDRDLVTIQCADDVGCSVTSNERMGRLWTRYKHAPPVLRVLRQATSRAFVQGKRLVHANLIYLSTRRRPQDLTLSRVDESTFTVEGPGGVTVAGMLALGLFMAGPWGVAATGSGLLPVGRGCVTASRGAVELNLPKRQLTCIAEDEGLLSCPQARGAHLDGQAVQVEPQALRSMNLTVPAGRHVLSASSFDNAATWPQFFSDECKRLASRAREAERPQETSEALPKRLVTQWQTRVGGSILDFHVADLDADGRSEILFGSTDGRARLLNADGKVLWTFETGDEVWAVGSADLDGDGKRELLAGSDDAYVYALDRDGRLVWKHSPPFGHQPWVYWTLYKSKIRKIASGDLNGDGKDEVVLGCGNMRCVAVSPRGKQLWEFRTDHGTCTTLEVADLDGDGRAEVIGGKGIFSSNSNGFRLNGEGKAIGYYRNQGWTSIVCSLLLTDLESDGAPEVIFGTDRGDNLRVFDAQTGQLRWAKCLGDNCEAIAVADLDGDGTKDVIAGSASLYVSAYTAKGRRLWYRTASDSITALATGDLDGDGSPEIVAGSADGALTVLDAKGNLQAALRSAKPIRKVAIVNLKPGGPPAIIVAGNDGALAALLLQ